MIDENKPGSKKKQTNSKESIAKTRQTKLDRDERIKLGNLTEDDMLFVERLEARRLLTENKKLMKQLAKVKAKELKEKTKLAEKARISRQKSLNRTSGVTITTQPNRPLCSSCHISLAKPNGTSKYGFKKWHKYCINCSKAMYNPKFGYLLHKKEKCECCDFIPEDNCQLDIVYKDGNKKNKNIENILTICANCNRVYQKKLKSTHKSILDITVDADTRI